MEELNQSGLYTILQCIRGRVENIDEHLDLQIRKGNVEQIQYWNVQKKKFIDIGIKLEQMTFHCED